jgi:hypothetical protein
MERSPGPTRPDRLTTWPVELGEFGVDVEWRTGRGEPPRDGDQGLLEDAGVRHRLSQGVDGRTWTLRVGRVRGDQVVRAIEDFLW